MQRLGILLVVMLTAGLCLGCSGAKKCETDQDCPEGYVCVDETCQSESGCQSGETLCGNMCVNLMTSDDHCGDCYVPCLVYSTCQQGSCVCNQGYHLCQEQCVNLDWDSNNCGICGNACADGQICYRGICLSGMTCEDLGLTTCEEDCADLLTDALHCGACFNACPRGWDCELGVCKGQGSCEELGLADCGGDCVNLANNTSHCGACFNACLTDQVCYDGVCHGMGNCEQLGLVDCDGICVDVDNDPNNCGDCDIWCEGFNCCFGECANLNNDINNCGACGLGCAGEQPYCDLGECTAPPCADDVNCNEGETCCDIQCCTGDQLCCTVPGPVGSTTGCSEPVEGTCPRGCIECICLSPQTPVATPRGYVQVERLRVGDLVYSIDDWSIRAVPVIMINRVPAVDHRVLRVSFENGSTLEISGPHPTADGRVFAGLRVGDSLGGVGIISVEPIDYAHSHTYDILPGSDSGSYFAAGLLIGSTLAE